MKQVISILTIAAFSFLTFASSDSTSSGTLKADEAKCSCEKTYKKSDGWSWQDAGLLCVTYNKNSNGIFCSRWCAQGSAMRLGKVSCN